MIKKSMLLRVSTEMRSEGRRWEVRKFVLTWRSRIQKWRHNAQTRKQLANLPAWLYPDIGLSEQQIRHEIQKKFWQ